MSSSDESSAAAPADPLEHLRDLALQMRQVLDGVLAASDLPPIPAGACAFACILLRQAINKFTPYAAVIRGGAGELQEGARDTSGRWQGHYWIEVAIPGRPETFLVDVTADQFGWPQVVCDVATNLAARYRAGDQDNVDEQIQWTMDWLAKEGEAGA